VPLVFDLGYMDVPFGQAEATSSNDIPLVERAAISNVATNIFANDFRSAFGARSFTDRYWAGAYVTGPTSGTNHTTGSSSAPSGAPVTTYCTARKASSISKPMSVRCVP
jgi:phosphate-selective porin OprO/OprP